MKAFQPRTRIRLPLRPSRRIAGDSPLPSSCWNPKGRQHSVSRGQPLYPASSSRPTPPKTTLHHSKGDPLPKIQPPSAERFRQHQPASKSRARLPASSRRPTPLNFQRSQHAIPSRLVTENPEHICTDFQTLGLGNQYSETRKSAAPTSPNRGGTMAENLHCFPRAESSALVQQRRNSTVPTRTKEPAIHETRLFSQATVRRFERGLPRSSKQNG